jgi:hypothetical protein
MNVIGEWRNQNNNVIEGDVYWKMKQMNNIVVQGEVDQFLGVQNMKQIIYVGYIMTKVWRINKLCNV